MNECCRRTAATAAKIVMETPTVHYPNLGGCDGDGTLREAAKRITDWLAAPPGVVVPNSRCPCGFCKSARERAKAPPSPTEDR